MYYQKCSRVFWAAGGVSGLIYARHLMLREVELHRMCVLLVVCVAVRSAVETRSEESRVEKECIRACRSR